MNDGLIPKRYAKALYKLAAEKGVTEKLYRLCATLTRSFEEHPELDATIANPYIADAKKTALLTTAAGADPKADAVFEDFLTLLEQNKRLPIVRLAALSYQEIYRKENHIYRVTVTSAAPMGKEEEERLKKLIVSHLKGGTMEYSFNVDPDLIGGFAVSIDNERLDASVRNDLRQLHTRLLGK